MKTIIFILVLSWAIAITIILKIHYKRFQLAHHDLAQSIEKNIKYLRKIQELNGKCIKLEMQNKINMFNTSDIAPDIKNAVYYAMKKSHPDNGGKEEDFIKFKKLHEELASRN